MDGLTVDRSDLMARHVEAMQMLALADMMATNLLERQIPDDWRTQPDLGAAATMLVELLRRHMNSIEAMETAAHEASRIAA